MAPGSARRISSTHGCMLASISAIVRQLLQKTDAVRFRGVDDVAAIEQLAVFPQLIRAGSRRASMTDGSPTCTSGMP
jgi:hypothetical protein